MVGYTINIMYSSYDEYRNAWKDAYKNDPPIPLNVDIELASVCNLKCPMCFYGEAEWNNEMMKPSFDGKPKKRLMPSEMARSIIDQCAELGVPALKFNWRGESTIHPEYSDILKYAAYKWRILVDNGYINIDVGTGMPFTTSDKFSSLLCFHDILVNTNANCKDHAIDGLMAATKCMISLDSTFNHKY